MSEAFFKSIEKRIQDREKQDLEKRIKDTENQEHQEHQEPLAANRSRRIGRFLNVPSTSSDKLSYFDIIPNELYVIILKKLDVDGLIALMLSSASNHNKVCQLETRHLDWHTRGGRRGYKVKFSFTQDGPKMLRLFAATVIGLDGSSYAQLDLPYYALSRIETLELLSCSADSAVSSFIGHCSPTLKELKVTGSQFSGDLLSQYSATFPLLKSLKLIRTQISNTGLCALLRMATHGKNLKNVELYFNPNITGQGLSEFSKSLVDLDSLNLSGCHLNDEGFLELFSHGKSNVKSLSVGYTITMSGVGLGKASIYFPQVQFVELYTPRETSQWTPAGFMNILKMCGPELRLVDVGPNLISTEVRTVLDERGISVVHNQQRKR